ncbi:AAA family ATPase [Chitinolyticbacter meiyuanensis]|uniref:AAA family ATPase n=1 Tax=Chitinolyticbacter meiyuanensis TaxID=682798 RepID=UPI0011E5D45B|nr:AAA family ATPase [Chitinolyticbacter meiyuanensis]
MNRVQFQHGLVIGKFYPPHLGHLYLMRTAARHCRQVTVAVLGASVESISIADRVAWLRECLADLPNVCVVGALDDVPVDYHDAAIWDAHVSIMRWAVSEGAAADVAVDAVFTSESYGSELARHFGATSVCLDPQRALHPVSGTAVRADLAAHWWQLPAPVRAGLAMRVTVVGAESTGTTTLARDLAMALQARGGAWTATRWVAEYGREYSQNLLALARARDPKARPQDVHWQADDFALIAAEQTWRENAAAREGGPVLVCDTDALATCIWHERYRGLRHPGVEAIAAAMPPRQLYLLTDHAGVPFEDDGLRDGETLRPWMTQRFADVLAAQPVPWLRLVGDRQTRLAQALAAVDAAWQRHSRFTLPLEQRVTA